MGKFKNYMYAFVQSQIKYWEERRLREKDPVLVALCIGRIEAYYNVLKEIEQVQNIAEYCSNDVIATEKEEN